MNLLSLATAVALLASPALAQFGPLVSPQQLAEALEGQQALVLDIRAPKAPEGRPNENTYSAGHIPGAINAPYSAFRGPAANPGQVPGAGQLTELLRSLGVQPDLPVIVVHQGTDASDFGAAARVYWTLKSSGIDGLSILNGGVNAWTEAGLPLSTEPTIPVPSTIEVSFSDQWLATADHVEALLGSNDALLLDARPEEFWAGNASHGAAARPGTLPQSKYFEHSSWFGTGAAVLDATAVQSLAAEQGFTGADEVISFCNTGHWAATNWFALSELAGIDNVKLYPESMVGWSNSGREMANVPGPMRNLWNQIKGNF